MKQQWAINQILSRTSCRNFSQRSVSPELITLILEAGRQAPSAKNRQAWFFLAIQNRKLQQELAQLSALGRTRQFAQSPKKTTPQLSSNDRLLATADVCILLFITNNSNYQEGNSHLLQLKNEQSLACAAMNMIIMTHLLALASCWICGLLYTPSEVTQWLKKNKIVVPSTATIRAALTIGYPAKQTPTSPKKDAKDCYSIINESDKVKYITTK